MSKDGTPAGDAGPNGGYGPQAPGMNPLIGAWSWQGPVQAGGLVSSTVVYGPDGSFSFTSRLPTGPAVRYWGSYQAQPAGPNQWRVETRVTGYAPQQVCMQAPGGPPSCQQAAAPPPGDTSVLTFTGPNTVQDGPITAYRDPSPVLAQLQIPAVLIQPMPMAPVGVPGGYAGGVSNCSYGATRCTNGWVWRCEMVGNSTMWQTGSQRC